MTGIIRTFFADLQKKCYFCNKTDCFMTTRLIIKDFGPISSADVEIGKFTVVIGTQGTGKSSLAKLFSMFSWLEKSLVRHNITESQITRGKFANKKFCEFHRISSYFHEDTYLKYQGKHYTFEYKEQKMELSFTNGVDFTVPKIEYIPAERNILSASEKPSALKGLPENLLAFLDDYEMAKGKLKEFNLPLSSRPVSFEYDQLNKISWLNGKNFRIRVSESSSGYQSLLPLCLVSKYLTDLIIEKKDTQLTNEEKQKLRKEVESIMSKDLSEDVKDAMLSNLSQRYGYSYFINIVEEVEQNLFPTSQKEILYYLIAQCNRLDGNRLFLTTHSPYIVDYLTLAVKASSIYNASNNKEEAARAMNDIVCKDAYIDADRLNIYQITEEGEVMLLPMRGGLPSDSNYLNLSLAQTNDMFNDLLDVEEM